MKAEALRGSIVLRIGALVMPLFCQVICAQAPSGGIAVLTYHRFDTGVPGPTTVTIHTLQSQLDYLSDHHIAIVPLNQAVTTLLGEASVSASATVVMTVDDGHRSVYTLLFPVIKEHHIPVTLFIYPSVISRSSYALTWQQLREMQASGLVTVQSHTYWHPDFRKEKTHRTADDYAAFVEMQLTRSRQKLEEELAIHVDLLAWPYGIVDADLEATARRSGYRAAFAYDGKLARRGDNPFAIHRIPVPDSARGAAFAALLHGARKKEASHAQN